MLKDCRFCRGILWGVDNSPSAMKFMNPEWDEYYRNDIYVDLENNHAYCEDPKGKVMFSSQYEPIAEVFLANGWGVTNEEMLIGGAIKERGS